MLSISNPLRRATSAMTSGWHGGQGSRAYRAVGQEVQKVSVYARIANPLSLSCARQQVQVEMSGSHSSSRPKTVHGGSIPQQQMSSSSSSVSSSSSHIHPHSAQPSLQSRSSSSGKPQSLKEKAFLEQLKEIQHMEQQTKQTLEMFMSTLNNRTTSEDCASLLLEKIEDLRKAEIEIDNKNVENGILQSKINELVERNENIVSINKKIMEEKGQLQHMLGESDKVIRKLESQFTLQQRNFSLDLEQRNSTIKVLEEEGTGIKAEVRTARVRVSDGYA